MSLGYGGVCRKALEDEETVIYTYRGGNLNLPRGKRERVDLDPAFRTPRLIVK